VSFEVVVRPVVFPNIRPAVARALLPADDPKKGVCEINSSSPHPVSLTYSKSINSSSSRPVETERRVDAGRLYQKQDDGTINRRNFVDIQVANRITKRGGNQPSGQISLWTPADQTQTAAARSKFMGESWIEYYKRMEKLDNFEIQQENKIVKNEAAGF
jgi:hypothetical protein